MAHLIKKGRVLGVQAIRLNGMSSILTFRNFGRTPWEAQQAATAVTVDTVSASVAHGENVRPVSEIPGPKELPFFGTTLDMLMDKDFDRNHIDKYWMKRFKEYGNIIKLTFPQYGSIISVVNPDDCEALARATMDNPVRLGFFSLAKIRKEAVDNYFENKAGLLHENGEEWKRVRSRVQTPMMKPKNVTSYLGQMDQVALDFMEKIAEFQRDYGEMPDHFLTELYKWSLESVGLVALNRRLGCLDPNLTEDSKGMILIKEAHNMMDALSLTEIGMQGWRFFATPAYKKLQRSHGEFLRVADQNIRQTEAQLHARKSNSEEDLTLMETLLLTPGLTRKDVITLILDMLFAGIDTTSHTVAFTLYLLAKNPKCQAKLQEELDSVIGDSKGHLTSKQMGQLSYLKMVVKESHRIFPLVMGSARKLQKDLVLSGYLVPKDYTVFTCNMLMGRDERLFPRAKEFIPERWSRERPLGPIHPFASMPFGLGTRMCIGRRIAEQEIYTFLARVLHRYSVEYKYKDMGYYTRLISVPSEPLRFCFTERR